MKLKGLLFGLILLVGCSSTPELTLYVHSKESVNKGRPLYVAIRYMDEQDFIRSTYQDISEKMFQKKDPLDKFLATEVIYPGKEKYITLKIKPEEKVPLAVFFIFLDPGDRWKTLVPQPLPSTWEIELTGNEIKAKSLQMLLKEAK